MVFILGSNLLFFLGCAYSVYKWMWLILLIYLFTYFNMNVSKLTVWLYRHDQCNKASKTEKLITTGEDSNCLYNTSWKG